MIDERELKNRLDNLILRLNKTCNWDCALIFSKVNQYYFTGTLQEGVLVIKKDGSTIYFIRKSIERAKMESNFYCLPMNTYADVARVIGKEFNNVFLESDFMSYAAMLRITKYITIKNILPIDDMLFKVRAVKSDFEIDIMKRCGKLHSNFMNNVIPGLLKDGMTECDFAADLYASMVKHGHHGVSRFNMFQMEIVGGQFGFSTNSLYPTNFDGPGGVLGMHPATPFLGNRETKLKKGDLVFVDIAFGFEGYHTDKTQVYYFGKKPEEYVVKTHNYCIDIQKRVAERLRPQNTTCEVYSSVMESIPVDFLPNFMNNKFGIAKFLGHGVGLHVDEYPVIAAKTKNTLKQNMVIAVEPKKGIEGIGLVGGEDTYIVTENGGEMITDGEREIIVI